MIAPIGGRAEKGIAGGIGAAFKLAWDGDVEGGDDGAGDGDLRKVGCFLSLVGGFGITCCLGVKPYGSMGSWVG